jgi:hypothetical protein
MADHWKSIANLLGAPGVDEPEVEATPIQPAPVEKAVTPPTTAPLQPRAETAQPKTETAQPASVEPRRSFWGELPESSSQEPTPVPDEDRQAHRPGDVSTASDRARQLAAEPTLPIPDEALSFKSLRSNVARVESKTQLESKTERSPSKPPAARSFSEPPPNVASEAKREAQRMPDRSEPAAMPAAAVPAKPAKRKSSWESLANMFNIKVDRSKPAAEEEPAPVAEQSATRRGGGEMAAEVQSTPAGPMEGAPRRAPTTRDHAPRRKPDPHLSIFDEEGPAESNAALKSMFGEPASTLSKDWGKPRIVDDLEWDEVEDSSADKSTRVEPEPAAEEDSDEEPARRGRRRRRGRRGRGDVSDSPVAARPSPASDKPARWGDIDEEIDEVSNGDDVWAEPDSFEFSARDGLVDDDDAGSTADLDVDLDAEDVASDAEPERRSSRRRRRGRGRGRDRERTDSTEPVAADSLSKRPRPTERIEDEEPVGFTPDLDEDDFIADELPEVAPKRTPVDDEERGGRSRRRRGRGSVGEADGRRGETSAARGARPSRETQRVPVARTGGEEDDFEADSETSAMVEGDDDDALGESKHRNIPTWADSIQSLVAANMENRKRGDNRGAPRGRPRGRR